MFINWNMIIIIIILANEKFIQIQAMMNAEICARKKPGWGKFLSIGIGTDNKIFILTNEYKLYVIPGRSLNNFQLTSTRTFRYLKAVNPNLHHFISRGFFRHHISIISVNGINLAMLVHKKKIEDNFLAYNLDKDEKEVGWDYGWRGDPIILLSYDRNDSCYSMILTTRIHMNQVYYNYAKKEFTDRSFIYFSLCHNTTSDYLFITLHSDPCDHYFFEKFANGFMFKKNLYLFAELAVFIIMNFTLDNHGQYFSYKKMNYSKFFACDRLDSITEASKQIEFN